jgi:hypothetical protein
MLDSCRKHPHEMGVALCGRCGGAWCGSCLVYAFGPKKPPYCMSCAMVAGGVRTSAALPAMPRKQLKAQMKALKVEAKAAAKAARATESTPHPEVAGSPAQTDWSTPWWEDQQAAALAD